MKKIRIVIIAIPVAALVCLAALLHQGRKGADAITPSAPTKHRQVPPDEASPAQAAATPLEVSKPAAGVVPSTSNEAPAARSANGLPEPSSRFMALIAELRPKVDAALSASDFQAADRHVDEVLATSTLEPLEKQRLMVVKLGARGMRGDHTAMLNLMDEIIAVDPDSPLSFQLRKQRPQLERIQRLGPNHHELCGTCGQMHAPGAHPPAPKQQE